MPKSGIFYEKILKSNVMQTLPISITPKFGKFSKLMIF
jgi:hypothetical protein